MLTRIPASIALTILLLGGLACSRSETLSNTEIPPENQLAQIEKRDKILVGIRTNAPPFAFVDRQDNSYSGLEIDIARFIAKELLGSEDRVQFVPIFDAHQRIELLERGKIDLAIAAIPHTPENQEQIDLSEGYYASGVGFLTRKDNPVENWSDLQDKPVCGVRGMSYNSALEEIGIELLLLRDRGDARVALQDGRCLGFAYNNSAIASILQLPQWSRYWHQGLPVLFSIPWSVGIAKGETELKKAVNMAILKMAAEGLIINNEAKWKIPATEYARDFRDLARGILKSQPMSDLKKRDPEEIDLTGNNILIDGSPVVFSIVDRIAKKFANLHPDRKIAIGISGNDSGFEKFCSGDVDFASATRPIALGEIQLCADNRIEYIELPIAFDGIVVVSNTFNNWTDCLTPNELNKIWEATSEKIVNWQQINPRYPDRDLILFGTASDSSTYEYFAKTIVSDRSRIRDDYFAYKDEKRIVREVAKNQGSLGFINFAVYAEHEGQHLLKPLRISNEKNRCVKPNSLSIADGTYGFLSRPLFFYVRKNALQDNIKVKEFAEYLLIPENSFAISEVGYIPLPQEVLEKVRNRLRTTTTGSIFAGESATGVRLFDRL